MKKFKRVIQKVNSIFLTILTVALPFISIIQVHAETLSCLYSDVNVRSAAGTSSKVTILGKLNMGDTISVINTVPTADGSTGCPTGEWYQFSYNGSTAYVCTYNFIDLYGRPWTTPKKAIVGGAIYKAQNFIAKGQYTSYLFKFNVNPSASNPLYTHQYMTNVRAPYFESLTTHQTYLDNNLMSQPLVFTIPIFESMPDATTLPEGTADTSGITAEELNDPTFESTLEAQGFPETYRKKLRILHKAYPNWVFESLKTGAIWDTAVSAEQPISYVDGDNVSLRETRSDAQADGVSCNDNSEWCLKSSSNWYLANTQTTAYYLDPRNFLNDSNILMFEKLAYSPVYTESIVQSRLDSTFMSGISALDNQTYASIFVEAGKTANISALYLISQCLQEVGSTGSITTTGDQFTYNGVTYKGLYNFFNVGAVDSALSPAKAGLVWANAGSTLTVVTGDNTPTTPVISETTYLNNLGFNKTAGYLTGIALNQIASSITSRLSDATVTVTDTNGANLSAGSRLTTGSKVVISDGTNTYTNTVVIYGDISGDGEINAIDLLYMRKHLLNTYTLTGANLQAAKIAKGSSVGAVDLLYLRKYLLDSQTYKIIQQ